MNYSLGNVEVARQPFRSRVVTRLINIHKLSPTNKYIAMRLGERHLYVVNINEAIPGHSRDFMFAAGQPNLGGAVMGSDGVQS